MGRRSITAGLLLAFSLGCGAAAPQEHETMLEMPETPLSEIAAAEWDALASRSIFFGHQSVGRDIMNGMQRVLADNPQIALRVASADAAQPGAGAALTEARIGRNREPATKSAAFLEALGNGHGDRQGAIAMYKFCYVDVNARTDPEQLFADYSRTIEEARRRHPDLLIVHFTLPLRTADDGVAARMKTLLGGATETRLNWIRSQYNHRLRDTYAATDPVFDLAQLESTRPDGSRAATRFRGRDVPMLASEWSSDGGHLNEAGQYRMAERLLVFLALVASRDAASQHVANGN